MTATLIIDTSYVIFAKYYSTYGWYKKSINSNPDVEQLFNSEVFKNKFMCMVENSLMRVCGRYDIGDTIFAKDCNRQCVWRRQHFPTYKGTRTHNNNFNSDAFTTMYNDVIPAWIARAGGTVIGHDGAEADDVVAVIKAHIRETDPERRVVILTNDNDIIQLVDERTTIINLSFHDVGERRGPLTPGQYLQSRILLGDRSDNIPSVLTRGAHKTCNKLVTEHDAATIKSMHACSSYAMNELLMDLTLVPATIQDGIVAKYNEYADLSVTI
jgi:DNA polymerase I